ncbi:peptide methionine sulfoxide reductase [Joostella sp.]|uniref:peptide methionine sulfoxide reductase n=1 Tax=Joostella sp. TaxID=2231138 RepID=UPI003A9598BB
MIIESIKELPLGYSEVEYQQKKYGVTRTDFNAGKSIKVYAEELGGNDFISLNYYITSTAENLKPCEMPQQKVIHFLKNYKKL